jgi:DNA methylase
MQCTHCGRILVQPTGRGRRRQFCNAACKMRQQRRTAAPMRPNFPIVPAYHLGRFEDYADAYAGQIDVIIVDPPYGRKWLPLYESLGQFAHTTLVPGGWLLCLTGSQVLSTVLPAWEAMGFEHITTGCYEVREGASQQRRRTSTGWYIWHEHHKLLLWYQKPGTQAHHRRGGTRDAIRAHVLSKHDRTTHAHPWEQSLESFQEVVRNWTNPSDVICDPCMGWGTTIAACISQARRRVIGIEMQRDRYDIACQRVEQLPAPA